MNVSIQLSDDIVQQIEDKVAKQIEKTVNEVIDENLEEVVHTTIRNQLKSATLLYIQSPECRNKMHEKVKPIVDSIIGG